MYGIQGTYIWISAALIYLRCIDYLSAETSAREFFKHSRPFNSAPANVQPSTPAAPAPAPASSSNINPPATPSPAPAPVAQNTETASFNDPSALMVGNQREAAIANMESMGFPRVDIDRAMRAAYFHPDRAVEYLLNVSSDQLHYLNELTLHN